MLKEECGFLMPIVRHQYALLHMSIQLEKRLPELVAFPIHDVVMHKRKIDLTKNLSIAEMLKESGKGYVSAFFGKGCTPMRWFKDHGYDVTDLIMFIPMVMLTETGGNQQQTPIPPKTPKGFSAR